MPRHFKPAQYFGPESDSVTSVERSEGSGPGWKRPMPRVSSMLFELELEDQELGEEASPPLASRQLLKLLQPGVPLEKQLGRAVHLAYESAAARHMQLSIDELADQLRSQGYDVRIRTALGGGDNRECLRNLRHQFMTLNIAGPDGTMVECIIDPSFAEQWGIARPTPAYTRIVAALPQVYVGSNVEPLVFFLCGELAAAFKAEGAMLPPWRSADAMLSKWRPRRSVDCDMLPPTSPALSAFQAGTSARRSLSLSRPAKSQRLNGGRPQRSSRSGSFGSGNGSPIGSGSMAGSFNPAAGSMRQAFALTKSASNALSDAEAQEAEAAEALADVDAPADGDASDSSNDSDFSFHGSGRAACAATLSSSWRASDVMPFQTLPAAGDSTPFGAAGHQPCGQPFSCRRASGDERVSGSDGSDTTAGPPPPPLHGSASHSQVQHAAGRLISAPPRLLHPETAFAASAPNPRSPASQAAQYDPFAVLSAGKPPLHTLTVAYNGGFGAGLQQGAGAVALPKSGLHFPRKSDGSLARKSGGRTVKLVPLFQAGNEPLHASNSAQL